MAACFLGQMILAGFRCKMSAVASFVPGWVGCGPCGLDTINIQYTLKAFYFRLFDAHGSTIFPHQMHIIFTSNTHLVHIMHTSNTHQLHIIYKTNTYRIRIHIRIHTSTFGCLLLKRKAFLGQHYFRTCRTSLECVWVHWKSCLT